MSEHSTWMGLNILGEDSRVERGGRDGRSSSGYSQEQPVSHIVVVREEAAVVESWGSVNVFAHQRGRSGRPVWGGSVVVAVAERR